MPRSRPTTSTESFVNPQQEDTTTCDTQCFLPPLAILVAPSSVSNKNLLRHRKSMIITRPFWMVDLRFTRTRTTFIASSTIQNCPLIRRKIVPPLPIPCTGRRTFYRDPRGSLHAAPISPPSRR